jgi:hypothetical protein
MAMKLLPESSRKDIFKKHEALKKTSAGVY